MAGRHSSKRNRRSRRAKARRRRVVGWVPARGRCWRLAWARWAVAPAAHADEFEVILDPIITALSSVDPSLGADVSTLVADFASSGGWDSVVAGWGSLDSVLGAASSAAGTVPDFGSATGAAASDSSASGVDVWSSVSQGWEQDWITSPFGSQVDACAQYVRGEGGSVVGGG